MKKIMVTGGSGFVGKNLLESLDPVKYEIHSAAKENGVRGIVNHKVDLCSRRETARLIKEIRPDILMHLAWNVKDQSYWHSLENNKWTAASLFLAEKFFEYGGRYFIFAGTSASYDYTKQILVEDAKMECPDSLYGVSKWYASRVISKMAEDANAKYLEARIFSVFGNYEREGRLVTNTIRMLLEGKQIVNRKWPLKRDYIYIKDAVRAIIYLMENGADGVYNISSGRAVMLKEIVECIGQQLNKSGLIVFDYPDIDEDVPCIIGCNNKLLDCGFHYDYTLDEAIAKTIKWYQEMIGF